MFIESIKENWKYENANDDAAVKLWNAKADYFGSYDLEEVKKEIFIQIIMKRKLYMCLCSILLALQLKN